MSAVDTVDAEVRETVRHAGLDPCATATPCVGSSTTSSLTTTNAASPRRCLVSVRQIENASGGRGSARQLAGVHSMQGQCT